MKKPMVKAMACALAFTMVATTPLSASASGIAGLYSTGESTTKTATATEAEGVVTTTGAYPRLLVKATGYYTGDTNPTPLYLYTKAFKTKAQAPELITKEDFAPAAIFEVEFTFSDENFLQQEKCVEVSVTPKKWNVIAVNPVL